jgi:hypothetical protein
VFAAIITDRRANPMMAAFYGVGTEAAERLAWMLLSRLET